MLFFLLAFPFSFYGLVYQNEPCMPRRKRKAAENADLKMSLDDSDLILPDYGYDMPPPLDDMDGYGVKSEIVDQQGQGDEDKPLKKKRRRKNRLMRQMEGSTVGHI